MAPASLAGFDITAIAANVPPGAYAIGVSGGADSTALLTLAARAGHLRLHVVHLNHETRGEQSDADAEFVRALAERLGLPCTVGTFSEFAKELQDVRNVSARFRKARLALFRKVVNQHQLAGVLLAHHADDNAETVLQRLLRGSGAAGLGGMAGLARIWDVLVFRPMLDIRRAQIVEFLKGQNQSWREDESNRSPKYLRNRLRRLLATCPALTDGLLAMAQAFKQLNAWTEAHAPSLPEKFAARVLITTPLILARAAGRRWLMDRGCPSGEIAPEVIDRLIAMCRDAATPARSHFPGNILVTRRAGEIFKVADNRFL